LLRRIPAIILSSSRQSRDITGAYEAGANAYLVKPVSYQGLLDMVRAVNLFWLTFNHAPETQPSAQASPEGANPEGCPAA
jgi:CheY-like chemotaxis protein